MVETSAFSAVNLDLISGSGCTDNFLKIVFSASLKKLWYNLCVVFGIKRVRKKKVNSSVTRRSEPN